MRDDIKLIEAALTKLENGTPPLNLDVKLFFTAASILSEISCEVGMISEFLLAISTAALDCQQEPR